MRAVLLILLLAVAGSTRGTSQPPGETVAGDGAAAQILRDADRLLEGAALVLGDDPIPEGFPEVYIDGIDAGGSGGALTESIAEFRRDLAAGRSRDALRSAFRRMFFAFHGRYEGLLRAAVLGHAGEKLMLFSASITCDCTRRLTDSYVRQLVQAGRIVGSVPPTLVLDCAADPSAMDRHAIEFLPTILLLDGENREISRLSVSEFILPFIVEHFQPSDADE